MLLLSEAHSPRRIQRAPYLCRHFLAELLPEREEPSQTGTFCPAAYCGLMQAICRLFAVLCTSLRPTSVSRGDRIKEHTPLARTHALGRRVGGRNVAEG